MPYTPPLTHFLQETLSIHPLNTPSQHNLSIQPTPCLVSSHHLLSTTGIIGDYPGIPDDDITPATLDTRTGVNCLLGLLNGHIVADDLISPAGTDFATTVVMSTTSTGSSSAGYPDLPYSYYYPHSHHNPCCNPKLP